MTDLGLVEERRSHYGKQHATWAQVLQQKEPKRDEITPEYLSACIRRQIDGDTIIVNEGVTNYSAITNHTMCSTPGTRFTSGASSIGWNGGAALGMKIAAPDKMVVCLTGDGGFMFSVPSTVHWMARKYQAPFLTVVYNNGGWRAPRYSMLGVHPDGFGSQEKDLNIAFDPAPDYSGIAAAAGGGLCAQGGKCRRSRIGDRRSASRRSRRETLRSPGCVGELENFAEPPSQKQYLKTTTAGPVE